MSSALPGSRLDEALDRQHGMAGELGLEELVGGGVGGPGHGAGKKGSERDAGEKGSAEHEEVSGRTALSGLIHPLCRAPMSLA